MVNLIYELYKKLGIWKNKKLFQDVWWNYLSFGVLVISGLLINAIITLSRGPENLGIFNISYFFYLILGQFASLGIPYAVFTYAIQYKEDSQELKSLLATAVIIVFSISVCLCLAVSSLLAFKKFVYVDAEIQQAMFNACLGVCIFPINKVLQSYLNSLRRMKAYALVQAVKYFIVLVVVCLFCTSSLSISFASISFITAELISLFISITYIYYEKIHFSFTAYNKKWQKKLFSFGRSAFWYSVLSDLNTRTIILILAMFLDKAALGVFSFIAMLVDGLVNALTVIRTNINPCLGQALIEKDVVVLRELYKNAKDYVFPIALYLSIIIMIFYCMFACLWVKNIEFEQGIIPLGICLLGIVFLAKYSAFENHMLISGHPGLQSVQQSIAILSNWFITLSLLSSIGISAAALGLVTGYAVNVFLMKLFFSKIHQMGSFKNNFNEH